MFCKVMKKSLLLAVLATSAIFTRSILAKDLVFTGEFPGGFNVSINGRPLTPSGPIVVTGILDSNTDIVYSDYCHAEFPFKNVVFTGGGFVNRPVATPLSLCIFFFTDQNFGFQRLGDFNQGVIGWNGSSSSGNFMTNIHDLSTIGALPYRTSGSSTFWANGLHDKVWTLSGGDTIGAEIGQAGPPGTFSIYTIPEPSTLALLSMGGIVILFCAFRKRPQSVSKVRRNATSVTMTAFLMIAVVHTSQAAEYPPSLKWAKRIGTGNRDTMTAMTIDGADNMYITGYTFGDWVTPNAGYSDALIAKYDSDGNACWAQQFGTSGFDSGGGIAWDGSTGLYVSGDWKQWDYHLSKSSVDGALLWTNQPIDFASQSNSVRSVKIAPDSSVYVCGVYGPLIKHDLNGVAKWTVNISGGEDMAIDRLGNVYMTGYSNSTGVYIDKISPSGAVLWSKTLGFGLSSKAIALSPAEDSFYLAGGTGKLASVSKYDLLGNSIWTKSFVGTGGNYDLCNDLAVDASGAVYVTGKTWGSLASPNAGSGDIFVRKYDPSGNDLWTWQYGTPDEDVGVSVAIGQRGDIFICGSINPYSTSGDGLIIALVPEPSTFALLGMGGIGLIAYGWRRKK